MTLKNIIQLSYWFGRPDMATGATRAFFWIVCASMVVGGAVCLYLKPKQKDQYMKVFLKRVATWGIVMGLLLAFWFTMRQQSIVFLSVRAVLAVWLIITLAWGYSIVRYLVTRLPAIRSEKLQQALREKYLPRSKR